MIRSVLYYTERQCCPPSSMHRAAEPEHGVPAEQVGGNALVEVGGRSLVKDATFPSKQLYGTKL